MNTIHPLSFLFCSEEVKRHIADHDVAIVAAHGRLAAALALGSTAACSRVLAGLVAVAAADYVAVCF